MEDSQFFFIDVPILNDLVYNVKKNSISIKRINNENPFYNLISKIVSIQL